MQVRVFLSQALLTLRDEGLKWSRRPAPKETAEDSQIVLRWKF
jgi:hypothetical protein